MLGSARAIGGLAMAEEESFKVTDRRGREQERTGPETTPGATAREESRLGAGQPIPSGEGQVDLQSLFVMFASSALVNLGEADPATGERLIDLDQARDAIDILLLLRDKTTGNRTEQESRLLEQIIYDVQMRYVQVTREAS